MADNSGRFEAVPAFGFPSPFPRLLPPFVTFQNGGQTDLFIDDLWARRQGRLFVRFYPVSIGSHTSTSLAILPLASPAFSRIAMIAISLICRRFSSSLLPCSKARTGWKSSRGKH